jgi:energy-coupling factor transporter ATP-binding protein EcfA2
MFNALDYDSMSVLLANEIPVLGVPVANTLKYYIDRTHECKRYNKLGSQNGSEVQHPWQQNTDVHESEYPNFQRNVTTAWRPNTLLDSENRIILVTGEPGMGKSTLLTHLAKETRQRHTDVWIVRININNYTRILHDIKANGFDEESAIKLLSEAAQIKETESVQLEKILFNFIYNSTGNMAVPIDGVDEVSPQYTEEVVQILRILTITKIRKIWVTSRNSVKGHLEEEFHCQSYSLLPFNAEDQKSFLVKFWNQKYSIIEKDCIERLATRVVELSFKHLSDKGIYFLGIPLQSLILAESFEEYLKQCSTSTTIELPEYLNIFMLFNLHFTGKFI